MSQFIKNALQLVEDYILPLLSIEDFRPRHLIKREIKKRRLTYFESVSLFSVDVATAPLSDRIIGFVDMCKHAASFVYVVYHNMYNVELSIRRQHTV